MLKALPALCPLHRLRPPRPLAGAAGAARAEGRAAAAPAGALPALPGVAAEPGGAGRPRPRLWGLCAGGSGGGIRPQDGPHPHHLVLPVSRRAAPAPRLQRPALSSTLCRLGGLADKQTYRQALESALHASDSQHNLPRKRPRPRAQARGRGAAVPQAAGDRGAAEHDTGVQLQPRAVAKRGGSCIVTCYDRHSCNLCATHVASQQAGVQRRVAGWKREWEKKQRTSWQSLLHCKGHAQHTSCTAYVCAASLLLVLLNLHLLWSMVVAQSLPGFSS